MATTTDKSRVLVVDDEPLVASALSHVLATEGYQVRTAVEGRHALARFHEWHPGLVITDLSMAPMNGIKLCRRIRAESDVPIIVASGESGEDTKIRALDGGADDYLVKPINTGEFLARVRAVLRRSAAASDSAGSFNAGEFVIDLDARHVYVRGNEVRLTPKEFDLLVYLARRPNHVVRYTRLLSAVWGVEYSEHREYLHVFMRQLRKKLEEEPSRPRYLLTDPWIGYRFNADRADRNREGLAQSAS